jgi:hypothetical protein
LVAFEKYIYLENGRWSWPLFQGIQRLKGEL